MEARRRAIERLSRTLGQPRQELLYIRGLPCARSVLFDRLWKLIVGSAQSTLDADLLRLRTDDLFPRRRVAYHELSAVLDRLPRERLEALYADVLFRASEEDADPAHERPWWHWRRCCSSPWR